MIDWILDLLFPWPPDLAWRFEYDDWCARNGVTNNRHLWD